MKNEIERKFLIKEMPDLTGIIPIHYERYFLYNKDGIEIRIQQKNDFFELERKTVISRTERTTEKIEISKDEFEQLKQFCSEGIERDSYKLDNGASIKIYSGKYKGLVRVEFEFNNQQELNSFSPPSWVGREITDSRLGKDSELIRLSSEEFKRFVDDLA